MDEETFMISLERQQTCWVVLVGRGDLVGLACHKKFHKLSDLNN